MRQLVAPFLILMTAGLLSMGTGTAAPLPTITVDPGYGPPLTAVQITGRSFCATCGPVALSVSALNVDTVAVGADGTFRRIVRIPGSTRPGTVTIAATQGSSTARATFTVTVNQPAPTTYSPPKTLPPPGNLPGGSVTGTPVRTTATATPTSGPTTASPRPSGSPASSSPSPSASASDEPTAVIPAADHPSGSSPGWPVAALAISAALLAGGTAWLLRHRRGSG